MAQQTILVADGDPARGQRVAQVLEAAGQTCRVVPHGAAALEAALADQPRVVVAQVDLPLVDALKLSEILRANPRTRSARFVFLGAEPLGRGAGAVGDVQLERGAGTEQILDAVVHLIERQERMRVLEERASTELDFGGTLAELRPAELLHMLHLRGATGRVGFNRDADDGTVSEGHVDLVEGEIRAARVGAVRGEKALFRILDWDEGAFQFEPGGADAPRDLATPTRALLAEGLRQIDEWNRLAPALPPVESPVRLCVDRKDLPNIVHPLTRDVLRLLEEFDRVGDVVDHCTHPDYQVLRTLHTLEERGIVAFGRAQIPTPAGVAPALFNEAQCRRLRSFALTGLPRDAVPPDVKLLVVAANEASGERFAQLLARVPGVELAPRFEQGRVGTGDLECLGRVEVDAGFGLDLVHLPADRVFAPLWSFASHRALGTIFLLDARVGPSAEQLREITDQLTHQPGARTFHVVMLSDGERLSPDELRDNLSLIDEASLFLLPIEPGKDPGSLLRSLFGRIVP